MKREAPMKIRQTILAFADVSLGAINRWRDGTLSALEDARKHPQLSTEGCPARMSGWRALVGIVCRSTPLPLAEIPPIIRTDLN